MFPANAGVCLVNSGVLVKCNRTIPTRGRGAPRLCTLLLVEISGIRHVVVDVFKVEAKLHCCFTMVTLVDLHHPGISRVNPSLKNRSVFECVSESRLTSRYLNHDWNIVKVISNDILRRSKLCNLRLLVHRFDLAIGRIGNWNRCSNVRNCEDCCKNAGYYKPRVLTNKNGRSRFQGLL